MIYVTSIVVLNRCFNAPSSNRVGWSVPVATHYQNNVTAGKWYNYSIPAMEISDTNHVLVGLYINFEQYTKLVLEMVS